MKRSPLIFTTALAATLALGAASGLVYAGPANAGSTQHGCTSKTGLRLVANHTWETKPTPKKGYKNVFTGKGKAVFIAVNGNGNGVAATVYTSRDNTNATLRLFAGVKDWCEVRVKLRAT